MADEFDVICIGAGPAGEALTGELKGTGLSLAVVERSLVGGECPFWGCMPTKTLLRSAEVVAEAGRARELAASRVAVDVDFGTVAKRTAWMTNDWKDTGAAQALRDAGATLVRGTAALTGPRTVEVEGRHLTARRAVVIATGTEPAIPRSLAGMDTIKPWTNRDAVRADTLPASMVVLGAGAVGVEMAQGFSRLGTHVHLIESDHHPLPLEEEPAGDFLQERLVAEGIEVTCNARAERVWEEGGQVHVGLVGGDSVSADRLLVATGRKPNLDGFDLAAAGVERTERGWVRVDPATLAAGDGVYAIGDINGLGGFTHLSDYHGRVLARRLRGEAVAANHEAVPRVTFTDPEVASVGVSEARALELGMDVVVGTASVNQSARGYIHGEPGGLIRLIADRGRGVLVGATIVSPRAGEMISEFVLAMRAEVPLAILKDVIHPFPTFSRILGGVLAEMK